MPTLDPKQLASLKYLGVDEVARAKGHDYMTVIYDMESGHLIGVETGRAADVLTSFLKRIPQKTADKIEAVAMDMGPSYQKALLKGTHYLLLKNADKPNDTQTEKLQSLLKENANMNTLYILKEQLQALWSANDYEQMQTQIEQWCLWQSNPI